MSEQIPIRPPVMPYRLIVFDASGARMEIIPFLTELELNRHLAGIGDRRAIVAVVDYLVNGGDEGSLSAADVARPRRRPRR
jgi:hypothetical protein